MAEKVETVTYSYVRMYYHHSGAIMNQYSMCVDAYIASAIFRGNWYDYATGG